MPVKPSGSEEEFFARQEFERRRQAELARVNQRAREEQEQRRALHHMKCPKCGMDLAEIDYRGLAVDKCLGCQGVWLDAGELEAVAGLEKSALDKFFSVFRR